MEFINNWASVYKGVSGRNAGMGWVVAKAKYIVKKQDDTNGRV